MFLFDEASACYKIYVVYKEIWNQNIEKGGLRVTKDDLKLPGGNATAVFGDIHGWKLNYPATCGGPYHRIMLYMAKVYLDEAEEHDVTERVAGVVPTRKKWEKLKDHAITSSPASTKSLAMRRFLEDI